MYHRAFHSNDTSQSSTCDLFPQVSWSLPHKQASSGTYQVKFFDEESYSALRKVSGSCQFSATKDNVFCKSSSIWMCAFAPLQAQRNNEDVNAIQPLFSVNIDHRVSLLQSHRLKVSTQSQPKTDSSFLNWKVSSQYFYINKDSCYITTGHYHLTLQLPLLQSFVAFLSLSFTSSLMTVQQNSS